MPEEIIYSAEDFERYYSGKMTEQEMHVLEKAALDDPFLADALEGYMHTSTAVSDIRELKARLQKKDKKKVVMFPDRTSLLKIAAVLVLFLGFSWLLSRNNHSEKTEIAAIKNENATRKQEMANRDTMADALVFTGSNQTGKSQSSTVLKAKDRDLANRESHQTVTGAVANYDVPPIANG